ncbi:hypothetical protein HK405_004974, partial [Cladochytrium tenue]
CFRTRCWSSQLSPAAVRTRCRRQFTWWAWTARASFWKGDFRAIRWAVLVLSIWQNLSVKLTCRNPKGSRRSRTSGRPRSGHVKAGYSARYGQSRQRTSRGSSSSGRRRY